MTVCSRDVTAQGAHIAGQQNLNQRIQHHQKIKDENAALKGELAVAREQTAENASRCVAHGR